MLSKTKKMFLKAKNRFQEKRLFFLSLLFIVFFLAIPLESAKAASIWTFIFPPLALPEIWNAVTTAGGCVANPLGCILGAIYATIYMISVFILFIASLLVTLGAYLVDVMLQPQIYSIVLNINNPNSAIMTGWTVIRDMGNTFFVLLLLIIAFSTILRIQQYSARNVLPKFIIVLFLMNFSAVFAGIVIDFGQVFMYEIRSWMGTFSSNTGAMGSLTSFVDADLIPRFLGKIPPDGGFSLENAAGAFFAGAFTLVMGAAYIMLAGFLLIRLIAFAILIVLSPAAILGLVMPGLHSISSEWWKKLWEYSVFGPLFIFFVFLAAQMASALKGYDPSVYDPALGSEKLGGLSYLAVLLVPYAVSLGMLYAVIPLTRRLGIAGASMLIGGTMGFGKILMGTYMAMKIPAMAGKKAGGLGHEEMKRRSGKYRDLSTKAGEIAKKIPIFGKIQIEAQTKKAEKLEKNVKEKEDMMKRMKPEDRKLYIDKQASAEGKASAMQAYLNLAAREKGGVLLNEKNLAKAGWEKDAVDENGKKIMKEKRDEEGKVMTDKETKKPIMEAVKEFDKEKFRDYVDSSRHGGHDMEELEKRLPWLIEDDQKRQGHLDKMIENDELDKIKKEYWGDAVGKKDKEYLKEKIGEKEVEKLINKAPQTERDTWATKDERTMAQMFDKDGNIKSGLGDAVNDLRKEIARLANPNIKLEKLKEVKIVDGQVKFEGKVDTEIAEATVSRMTPGELGNQNIEFHKEVGHLYDPKQVSSIYKDRDISADVKIAIEESVIKRVKKITDEKGNVKKGYETEFDQLQENLKNLKSKLTRPTAKKEEKEKEEEED